MTTDTLGVCYDNLNGVMTHTDSSVCSNAGGNWVEQTCAYHRDWAISNFSKSSLACARSHDALSACCHSNVVQSVLVTNVVVGETSTHGTYARQDPHLRFAHGGEADFRGRDGAIWNFLSSERVSLNVRTLNASFLLRDVLVHGSFITDAYIVSTDYAGTSYVSFVSGRLNENNYAWDMVNMTCVRDHESTIHLMGPYSRHVCAGLNVTMSYSSMRAETDAWLITVSPNRVYSRVSGPHHRLDITVSLKFSERLLTVKPHGILGQAYDGDNMAVEGRKDVYPQRGTFVTSAMAEGAIEGVADDYEMYEPFNTSFAYSRYRVKGAKKYRSMSGLSAHAFFNVNRASYSGGVYS